MPGVVGGLLIAGLEGAGVAGVGGFSLGSTTIFGVSLTSILGSATLLAASVAVGYLTKPGGPSAQDGHQPIKQSIPARNWGYGRNRIAGAYMLFEAKDDVSFDVMALVSGRVKRFVDFYLSDDKVSFVGGVVPNGASAVVAAGEDGRYGDGLVSIGSRYGVPAETAYTEPAVLTLPGDVVGASGGAGASIWNSSHRGDGIASMMLRCYQGEADDFLTHFPNGLPKPSAVIDCYPIRDPRDPAQNPNDDSNWQAVDNPVLVIIDYLTDPDHGLGMSYARLITPVLDVLMAEADKCDELIPKKAGGTEKRYRCNTWGSFDMDPSEALADMLASCDGWISLNGDGTLALKVGVYDPDLENPITVDDIVGFSVDLGVADEETVNEFVLGYTSPLHDYTTVPGEPWRDEAAISLTGKVRSKPFSPKSVQSHGQLRRLAKRNMARLNARLRGQMTTTLFGLVKAGKRWTRLQYPFFAELADCIIEIRRMQTDFVNGTCTFDWVLINQNTIDVWDPATEEGDEPIKPDKLVENGRQTILLDGDNQPIFDSDTQPIVVPA